MATVTFDKPLGQVVENALSTDDPILQVAETADVVRDANGNIISKVVDGKIDNEHKGEVVGRDAQGRLIDASGKVMGHVKGANVDAEWQ